MTHVGSNKPLTALLCPWCSLCYVGVLFGLRVGEGLRAPESWVVLVLETFTVYGFGSNSIWYFSLSVSLSLLLSFSLFLDPTASIACNFRYNLFFFNSSHIDFSTLLLFAIGYNMKAILSLEASVLKLTMSSCSTLFTKGSSRDLSLPYHKFAMTTSYCIF